MHVTYDCEQALELAQETYQAHLIHVVSIALIVLAGLILSEWLVRKKATEPGSSEEAIRAQSFLWVWRATAFIVVFSLPVGMFGSDTFTGFRGKMSCETNSDFVEG